MHAFGRKPEYPEKTHPYMGGDMQTPHRKASANSASGASPFPFSLSDK